MKAMLSKNDFKQIETLVTKIVSQNNKAIFKRMDQNAALAEEIFASKDDIKALDEKVSHLPTKDEFYKMEDKLMGEVQAEREENALQEPRIARLEQHCGLA